MTTTARQVSLAIAIIVLGIRLALAGDVKVIEPPTQNRFCYRSYNSGGSVAPTEEPEKCDEINFSRLTGCQTDIYTRVDYLRYTSVRREAIREEDDGCLITLGFAKRIDRQRFRAELFTGDMNYGETYDDTSAASKAGYFGGRGEYEYIWNVPANQNSCWDLYFGVGTQAWVRDVRDGENDGLPWDGYTETWWTVYPYLGLSYTRDCENGLTFFCASRMGVTAFNYMYYHDHGSDYDHPVLYMDPNLTGQVECGISRGRFFGSFYFDVLSFQKSELFHMRGDQSNTRYYWSATSQLFTIGLKAGLRF